MEDSKGKCTAEETPPTGYEGAAFATERMKKKNCTKVKMTAFGRRTKSPQNTSLIFLAQLRQGFGNVSI